MADPVSKNQLLQTARKSVPEITPADLAREISSRKPILVDVRETDEMDAGIVPGARKIPRGFLELRIEEAVPERDAD
ncbi:MAG: rhodanese-like domain-containing protein, partial [Myxococcales bacterium]